MEFADKNIPRTSPSIDEQMEFADKNNPCTLPAIDLMSQRKMVDICDSLYDYINGDLVNPFDQNTSVSSSPLSSSLNEADVIEQYFQRHSSIHGQRKA